MTPIDPNDLKAELPEGLRAAMKLDLDQFEELEVETLKVCMQFADVFAELDIGTEPTEMQTAWRPTRNPNGQYFAIMYNLMIDPNTRHMRCEVEGFKPMVRSEYIKHCMREYGEAPPDLLADSRMN